MRRMDMYDVGPPPEGKSWQWINAHELEERLKTGWLPVDRSRIPGDCDHFVIGGVAIVALDGSLLVERDSEITHAAQQAVVDKAWKNVQDWIERNGGSAAVRITASDHKGNTKVIFQHNAEQLTRPAEARRTQEITNAQDDQKDVIAGKGSRSASGQLAKEEGGGGDADRRRAGGDSGASSSS